MSNPHLLRLITFPYVRQHWLRCALTLAGTALGIAVFVAMHAASQSVLLGFRNSIDRIAGKTQLQVTAGDVGFDEGILDRVRSVREVERVQPVIEAVVQTGRNQEGNLLILGVDMLGDAGLRDYVLESDQAEPVDDPLVFLAQPDSLILARDFAERNGLAMNSKLTLQTMDGRKEFTIRGLLRQGGIASAYGGNLAIMDVYAAQNIFGRGRRFDRLDVVAGAGSTVEQTREAIRRVVGEGLTVDFPERRGQNFQDLLMGYSALVNITSVFALFIGMFMVYNSFSTAVSQRQAEIGTLRALGASRHQIRNLFLMESAVMGVLAAAAGSWIGLTAAKALAEFTAAVAAIASGFEQNPDETAVNGWLLLVAAVAAVITSMIAAWIPAGNAARIEPVMALQKGKQQSITSGENRYRTRTAVFTMILSTICFFWGSNTFLYVGFMLVAITAVLLAPTLSHWLARFLRTPLRLLFPVEGSLAADSLIHAPRRTSATVAALMSSLAIAISMAGTARAAVASIEEWVNTTFNADLVLSTSPSLNSRSFHFPAIMQKQLESMPDVDEVQPVRTVLFPLKDRSVMLIGFDVRMAQRRNTSRRIVAGDYDTMHRLAIAGEGLIISEHLALLQKIKLGDAIELAAPGGILRRPVVGVFRDFSNPTGAIYMDLSVFRRYWHDDSLDLLHVYLRPGVQPFEAKRRILARFDSERRLFVLLNSDLRQFVLNISDQWFGLTYVQMAVAVLVAVLGIVNSLTVSTIDRQRELGILRAIGGVRKVIRRTLWLEAMTMSFMGVLLGVPLGGISLFYQLAALRRSILATPLDYIFPFRFALLILPIMLAVAFFSALGPAESALRRSLVKALESE